MRTNESGPAYRTVYEDMREKIVGGDYAHGLRLPSKRSLAAEYGVSVITVEHAYALLCDEGYAEARERSGFFVSYRQKDSFPVKGVPRPAATAQPSGTSDFPFSVYARTVRRALADYGNLLTEKSPTGGLPQLRETIAAYLARGRNIRVSPENIVVGSGSEYLYTLIPQLLGRGRIFAVESPSYGQILRIYRAGGIICEELPLGPAGIDSETLERSRANVLHITPYRSYPTMVTASASKRHEYLRWAETRAGYLIEDDVESEFSPLHRPTETLYSLDSTRVIYLNTFSRTVFPGLRMAYMVLPDALRSVFAERAGFLSCPVPTLEQVVLTELIAGGDFERNLNRERRRRKASRAAEPKPGRG